MMQEESKKPLLAEQRTSAKTILVVEDDEAICEVIALLLATATGYHYYLEKDASQAVDFARRIKPDLLIVNYRLAHMNGLELYDLLHATPGLEDVPALLMTAAKLETLRPEIEQRQISALEKPFDLDAFLGAVQGLLGEP